MWYFAGGDAGFYFPEQLRDLSWLPVMWRPEYGFGANILIRSWFDYPYELLIKSLFSLGLSWFVIDKLLWLSVFVLAAVSSYKVSMYVIGRRMVSALSTVIYSANTYILLLFGGGQLGVALAYAFSPSVFLVFMRSIDSSVNHRKSGAYCLLVNGLLFAVLTAFDLRISYLMAGAIAFYFLYRYGLGTLGDSLYMAIRTFTRLIIIPILLAAFIHGFWIVPVLVTGGDAALGEELTNAGMVRFLSFADFSHAISLLHPNWPENLFGRVYFMQPEFLLIPVLAYSSLLFLGWYRSSRSTSQGHISEVAGRILFFVMLSLAGAFMAKGTNGPLGVVYETMFRLIPGFVMFRDPTKFYLFTAIGYSILIPFSLQQAAAVLKTKHRRLPETVGVAFILLWALTLRQLFAGKVSGNFRPPLLTDDYVRLKDTLVADTVPSRTLWITGPDAFAYFSPVHPVLSSDQLFSHASVSSIIAMTETPEFGKKLRQSGVGYVIVSGDPERRLFLKEYEYDPEIRIRLLSALDDTKLSLQDGYRDLRVYRIDHDPMMTTQPEYVDRQTYWTGIGMAVSAVSLGASLLFLAARRLSA
jgi:hypothetical protein